MSLLQIFASAPDSVGKFSIEQIVAIADDGVLRDSSLCSDELRTFLGKISTEQIAGYVAHCLDTGFAKSGLVLQDLVNELGRRLDYHVTNGRYSGVTNRIGFDGLWRSPEEHGLVVEVKTTDAYRLSLDTLATYRARLAVDDRLPRESSILIIVGRQDTGELEAQIRGSRHAWDIRLISTEALIKLVLLKENSEAAETGRKMRSLLTPIEYTRLDRMVDVMFATANDVEADVQADVRQATPADQTSTPADTVLSAVIGPSLVPVTVPSGKPVTAYSPSPLIQAERERIVHALGRREQDSLVRRTRTLYATADGNVRAACGMSKHYEGMRVLYWYAYHPQWDEFLAEGGRSFFVLGCVDRDVAYAIPRRTLVPLLPKLNTTTPPKTGVPYWHIHLIEHAGDLAMIVPKDQPLPLTPFALPLA